MRCSITFSCLCICVHAHPALREIRRQLERVCSLHPMWVPGTELRSWGLATRTLTYWAILLVLKCSSNLRLSVTAFLSSVSMQWESTWHSVFPLCTAKWAMEPDFLPLLPVILLEEEKLAPSWAGGCLVFFLSAFGTAQWFSPPSFPAVKSIWRGILAAIRDREMWIYTRTWKQLEWRDWAWKPFSGTLFLPSGGVGIWCIT